MTWALVLLLALASLGLVLLLMRRAGQSRAGWDAIATALLLGIAGYALQGSPGLPGAPREPVAMASGSSEALVAARKALDGKPVAQGNWVVVADALARHGQYGDAAGVLAGAVKREPDNGEAWLALANSLVGHAEGTLSPAALYAYRNAIRAAPDHPGPPFFLGLAMAQSGRFAEARDLWAGLLAKSPPDAPWRADLQERLARLDALIARQEAAGGQPGPQPGTAP
ncbi:MAG: tetratricopeptide repeat protein [Novosphingobium sp.]